MRILQVEVLIFPNGLEGCVAGGIVAAPSLANSTEAVLLGRPGKSSCNLSSIGVVFGIHLRNTPSFPARFGPAGNALQELCLTSGLPSFEHV